MLEKPLLLLVIFSWLYWLTAWWMTRDFFASHGGEAGRAFLPPVSILKPVKGLDPGAYENFRSFCRQDYPQFELLFGVADADDPVVPVVERLRQDFPERNIRLFVAPLLGANHKVSLLHHLADKARHEILAVSDSDIRVEADYLRRVVGPLADEGTGLVTCPYRGELPLNLTARLEALHMGATFLPSVIVARWVLRMRFGLGATLVLRRADLARLGGFASLADYLADDYQLGARLAGLGLRVHLTDCVVASVLGATTFREEWRRELRWARCNRVSRPLEYPGYALSFSTPLAAILGLLYGLPEWWRILALSLILRWLVAWLVSAQTGDRAVRVSLLLLPLRDLLSALVWCVGGFGRRIHWRGEDFILESGGRMLPAPHPVGTWRRWHLLR